METNVTTMKAVHYEKPFSVSVREIPEPKIEHPDDVIIKVTTAGKGKAARVAISSNIYIYKEE